MIKFKINGVDTDFPTGWNDLTYSQYLAILQPDSDLIKLIAAFIGMDHDTLRNAEIPNFELLVEAVGFLRDENSKPEYDLYYPKIGPYLMNGKAKNGLFDIRLESFGQFEDMRAQMITVDGSALSLTQFYGKAVAIYLQKIRDGVYIPSKVSELEEEVKNFKACEVIAMGQFFFLKLGRLSTGTPKTSPTTGPTPKKSKRASTTSKRNSARTR